MVEVVTSVQSAGPAGPAGEPLSRQERLEVVARAADRWADEVSRLGGRNTLLRYADLKAGTLDLAAAEPEARKRLLGGTPVLVSQLYPHEPLRTSALRSARALHLKVRELAVERGIWTGHLGVGIATWSEPYAARRPAVPVFLRRLTIVPTSPAETDFELTVAEEPQVNPVLLLAMATRVGIRLEADDLRDPKGRLRYPFVVDRLREHAPAHVVDGFAIAHRAVLATFTDSVLDTAAALRREAGSLGAHLMPRLLAGLEPAPLAAAVPDQPAPLVLPADDEQAAVVDGIVAGGSLAVLAGPGTGLTQTLANVVAALVGQGRSVLVTAEPQAPLADLAGALQRVGLGDAVLELRPEVTDADALADVRGRVEAASGPLPVPGDAAAPSDGPDAGQLLAGHAAWSRTPVAPWGVSPYEAQVALLRGARNEPVAPIEPAAMSALHGPALDRARRALADLADEGGLEPAGTSSAWDGARLVDEEAAAAAVDAARRLLRDGVTAARDAATRAAVELGHPVPASLGDALAFVTLLDEVRETLGQLLPEVWSAPLDDLVSATGDRTYRAEHPGGPSALARRRLRRAARDLLLDPATGPRGPELQAALEAARDRLVRWRRGCRDDRPPALAEHSAVAITTVGAAGEDLLRLEAALPDAGLGALRYAELSRRLTGLVADAAAAKRAPRLSGLRRQLTRSGLGPLVDVLVAARSDRAAALVALDRSWHAGVLAAARSGDPLAEVADPGELLDRYGRADARVRTATALAARARTASSLRAAATDPAAVEALGAARTLADALDRAPGLVQAAAPVWLVPTLRVAQSLPPAARFDLVVVEAAHLVDVASAVPALTAGARVVVAGDPLGPPPVEFSVAAEPETEPDTDGTGFGGRAATASLLDAVRGGLPERRLGTHYRSADERLVRLAATQLTGAQLAAWPGSDGGRALRLDLVAQPPLVPRQEESVGAEVAHVVDLVLDHARNRPEASLAVVTLGARHAERVREAVRAALGSARELEPFFALDRPEPFEVVSLDHVRAEVRDVVVLSVGYGRTGEGRLLYRFGALAQEGGERRLAAATTRARQSLVVVSTFRGEELNPRRLLAHGPRLLRELLLLADSAGSAEDTAAAADPGALAGRRPLHDDLVRRLRAAGLPVVTDVGWGALRVAVALRDPDPAGPDLAVLTDAEHPMWSTRQRDLVVPTHLRRLGWHVVRVWSARWVADPDTEVARVVAAWESAGEEARRTAEERRSASGRQRPSRRPADGDAGADRPPVGDEEPAATEPEAPSGEEQ